MVSKHNDDKQWLWESNADGNFAVSEDTDGEPLGRGTLIKIHVKVINLVCIPLWLMLVVLVEVSLWLSVYGCSSHCRALACSDQAGHPDMATILVRLQLVSKSAGGCFRVLG